MKVRSTIEEAISDVQDGATVMFGGFGLTGLPAKALYALYEKNVKNLTIIANNPGPDVFPGLTPEGFGFGILLEKRQVKNIICSYIGEHLECQALMLAGEVNVTLIPQGTLAERMRAAGAGIPAFYTATGVGTPYAEGKESRVFDGREYLLERALSADFAFVKAHRGDTSGNLIYSKTSRNFNPVMATAGKVTIAEVEELVEEGELDPSSIQTPGIYVNRIVHGQNYRDWKPIYLEMVEQERLAALEAAAQQPSSGGPIQ